MTIKFGGDKCRDWGKYTPSFNNNCDDPHMYLGMYWIETINLGEQVGLEEGYADVELKGNRHLPKYTTEDVEHMINLVMLNACIGFLDNTEDTLSELS